MADFREELRLSAKIDEQYEALGSIGDTEF